MSTIFWTLNLVQGDGLHLILFTSFTHLSSPPVVKITTLELPKSGEKFQYPGCMPDQLNQSLEIAFFPFQSSPGDFNIMPKWETTNLNCMGNSRKKLKGINRQQKKGKKQTRNLDVARTLPFTSFNLVSIYFKSKAEWNLNQTANSQYSVVMLDYKVTANTKLASNWANCS